MKFDEFNCIVSEDKPYPSSVGEACADTSRHVTLTGHPSDLNEFVSAFGFLRHRNAPYGPPDSLKSWRESDASGDMVFSLLMACDMYNTVLAEEIRQRLKSTWTIRPGVPITPALFALVYKNMWLLKQATGVQELIFRFNYRWSDSDEMQGKWWKFEKADGSSADWMNYAVSIVYLRAHGVQYPSDNKKIMAKVRDYWKEQNAEWIIDAFAKHFPV